LAVSLLAALLKAVLEMDHVRTTVYFDRTIYIFKTTALDESLAELKAKILSLLDLPVDVPIKVAVDEVKSGYVFKEYLVAIEVPRKGIGPLENLLARKYPFLLKERPYK